MSLEEEIVIQVKAKVNKNLSDEDYVDKMADMLCAKIIRKAIKNHTEERLTTDEILEKYKWSPSKLSRFCAEGMKYVKGSPNTYLISDIEDFLTKNKTMYRRAHSKI